MIRHFGYLTTLFILLVAACSDPKGYEVRGTIENVALEGKTVYFVPFDIKKDHPSWRLDSTTIKDGRFSFRGNVEGMAYIRMAHDSDTRMQELIVVTEPGLIEVTIDTVSSGGGTPQNDGLQQWKEFITDWRRENQLIQKQAYVTEADSLLLQLQLDSLSAVNKEYAYRFMKQWCGSTVGDFMSHRFMPMLTQEQQHEITGE